MNAGHVIFAALLTVPVHHGAVAGDFNGVLKSQTAYSTEMNSLQQQEWLVDIEYNDNTLGGNFTAITRVRVDTISDLNHASIPDSYSKVGRPLASDNSYSIDLRELYWDIASDVIFLRLGKQQVVWGEADGLKLLDVINPQSFREFIIDDFDDSRIPLWMVNAEYSLSNGGVLQFLWIPDTSTHELAPAHSPFAYTSPIQVPQLSAERDVVVTDVEAPTVTLKNSDAGMRFVHFINGWDISLNYLYHYVDTPVAHTRINGQSLVVTQGYERSHLMGGTASNAFGDWTLRAELTYETNRFYRSKLTPSGVKKSNQWNAVIGVDWQGWTDQFISAQWFQTRIIGTDIGLMNDRREDLMTFLWQSNFFNETLTLEWLHIHSLNYSDGSIQSKLTYNYKNNIDVYVGADNFYGNQRRLFGQFKNADRISIGLEWGF